MMVPIAPLANSSVPATWSGVLTTIFSPYLGSLVMVRSPIRMPAGAALTRHRAEQRGQRGEIVGAHVEHGARAELVVVVRIGVPAARGRGSS